MISIILTLESLPGLNGTWISVSGQGKLDKARAEYQKMRNTQEFAEKNIPVEVVKYYQDAVEAQKSFTAYEQAAVGSRRWIVTAFSNFDLGIGTARDMFDAIDRYGKNQGNYLQSLYNYHVSLARLDYAIGKENRYALKNLLEVHI